MANYPFERLKGEYSRRWAAMTINPSRRPGMELIANKIIANQKRYENLQKLTGVPWYFIGMLHFRESSCNFNRHLHNGDPLSGKTYHVPAGRIPGKNPPYTFEESAVDALAMMGYTKIKNWTVEQIAYRSEMFNGFGYRMNGFPSAYLWAGTNQYRSGKYIADGVFDPNAVDTQQGTMGVLKVILEKTHTDISGETIPKEIIPKEPKSEEEEEHIAVTAPKALPAEPTATVMNKVSRKFYWNDWLQWISGIFGTGAATVKAVDVAQVQATRTYVDTIRDFAQNYGILVVLIIMAILFAFAMYQKRMIKEDVVEGRYTPSEEEKKNLTTKEDNAMDSSLVQGRVDQIEKSFIEETK